MTKFFIDLHGCAKNQVDAELIATRLSNVGFLQVESEEEADLIIINSCGFIESAKTESLEALMNYRADYPEKKIILAGCLAERYGEIFAEEISEADGILGNGDLTLVDELVTKVMSKKSEMPVLAKGEQKFVCDGERHKFFNFPGSAYVKITEGCNNYCSFCAIPIIRGNLRSRSCEKIVSEISELIQRGVFEINLIGQDLAAYGTEENFVFSESKDDSSKTLSEKYSGKSMLYRLLKNILSINKDFALRLLYIHPDHFPLDILELVQEDKRILPYFDIPFQSGDDEIIKLMNRQGDCDSYINLIEKIRKAGKNTVYGRATIRTTFLCGFPGESGKAAKNTENFLKAIKPDWSGCFTYSREDDTPAATMKKQVPQGTAQKRATALQVLQEEITEHSLSFFVGQELDVLVEEIVELDKDAVEKREAAGEDGEASGVAIGRSWFQAPEVDGATVIYYDLENPSQVEKIISGKKVKVKIIGTSSVDIYGYIIN